MFKLNKFAVAAVTIFTIASSTGCADAYSNNTYAANQSGVWQNVSYGVVTNVRQITIQEDNNMPVGAVAGAVVGGLLGHAIGGGTGKKLATVGGVVLGGLAGNAAQTQANKTQGLEIEVRLDNGQTISTVQSGSQDINVGTRVRITDTGGRTKISAVSNVNSGNGNAYLNNPTYQQGNNQIYQ